MSRFGRIPGWVVPAGVGALLRLPGLGTRPLWYDEAFSVLLARRPVSDVLAGTAADTMPPGYYLLLKAWMGFGESVAWMRLLNVMLGVVLVVLVYHLGKEALDDRAAALGAGLAAISPLMVYHAQELRMYTLLGVGLVGHVVCALRAERFAPGRSRRLAWIGSVGFGTVALYSHNLAAFSLLGLPLYYAIRRQGRALAHLLLAGAAMVVLFGPWLALVPGQIAKIQAAFWTPRPGILESVQALVAFHAFLPVPESLLPIVLSTTLLAFGLTVYLLVRSGFHDRGRWLLASMASVPVVLLFIASFVMRPVFVPRALMLPLAAYLLLAGRAIAGGRPRAFALVVGSAFIASAGIGLPSQLSHDTFPRSPFPQAIEHLRATNSVDTRVLHDNKLSFFPMYFYAPDLRQAFLADEPGSHNDTLAAETEAAIGLFAEAGPAEAARGASRVRYVVFQRALDEYAAQAGRRPPGLAWLEASARLRGRTGFGDLWIYDFDIAR